MARDSREQKERNVRDLTYKANADRMIAKSVVRAQGASDAGKDIDELCERRNSLLRVARDQGYNVKSYYILDAIKRINGSKRPTSFTYYVEDHDKFFLLVYFGIRIGQGKYKTRYQISFHVPKWEALYFGLNAFIGKGTKMRWDKVFGGSREAAQFLIDFYRL